MTTTVIHVDRLQMGLKAWIPSVLTGATVAWHPAELPRDATAPLFVQPRLLSGLTTASLGGTERYMSTLPMQATITISGVSSGDSIIVSFSGLSFEHTATAGQTNEDVRDALLTTITSSLLHSAAAIGVGTDRIRLTAPSVGDLYGVSVGSSADGIVSVAVDSTQIAQVTTGVVEATVQLQSYSTRKYLRLGAAQALATLLARQNSLSSQELLESYTIAILGPVGQIIDLTALSGPQFESRASVNVQFSLSAIYAEAVDIIETATAAEEYRL